MRAAYDIARFTAEDPAAGLPDAERPRHRGGGRARPRSVPSLGDRRRGGDRAGARAARPRRSPSTARITNSEGAGVSAQQSHFYAGNTRGFGAGYASSRHSLSVAPIASLPGKDGDDMQRDAWYTLDARRPTSSPRRRRSAATPPSARCRASASRKIKTCEVPVLFESSLASGLLGAYVQATSGGALYRKSSFLLDSLGKRVLRRAHRHPRGSAPAARQGQRAVRRRGRGDAAGARSSTPASSQSYFLSTYSARKLGMRTTGHAGGSHNLTLTSRLTRPATISTRCCGSSAAACS